MSADRARPRPAPTASCGGTVQAAPAGSQPSAARPPEIRITPDAARVQGADRAREARGQERRDRHHRHDGAGLERLEPPAVDEQDHEQEERRDERAGDEHQRGVCPEVRPLQRSKRGREAHPVERRQSQQQEGRLHDEDRLPPEQLGEEPADSRPARGAEDSGEGPDPRRRGVRSHRSGEQPQRGADDGGARDSLDGAGGDQHAERRSERACERGGREDHGSRRKTGVGRRRATNAAGSAESASARLNEVSAQASVSISTSYCARISGSAIVTTDESARTIPTERPRSAMRVRAGTGWA